MSRLYACIISPDTAMDKDSLLAVARTFAYSIEALKDGVLFNISGLERLIGNQEKIVKQILGEMETQGISGSLAVAAASQTAILLARQDKGVSRKAYSPATFQKLPLGDLDIPTDTLKVFQDLGVHRIEDLLEIPRDDLVTRYGREFEKVIDTIEQRGVSVITANVKDSSAAWSFDLDFPVDDFEQLIFIVNHGLDNLFSRVAAQGFSTEHIDISFKLCGSPRVSKGVTPDSITKSYAIKTSFPTLDKTFWLKLINLRISLDAPEAAIVSVCAEAHFAKPRPGQRGLYAVSRPEPESLLLTVGKLKKLVGEENVGVPVLLDQRVFEPFALDADKMPQGKETLEVKTAKSVIAFTYYRPPVRAEVLVRDGRLVFIKTRFFSGHVTEYSGVWRANSKWWSSEWKIQEWDVEVESHGIYRLCKAGMDWFLMGEYD
ncbi:MAG: hypothetical protein WKF34_02555 [Pyrinomonadaceae bacterium]